MYPLKECKVEDSNEIVRMLQAENQALKEENQGLKEELTRVKKIAGDMKEKFMNIEQSVKVLEKVLAMTQKGQYGFVPAGGVASVGDEERRLNGYSVLVTVFSIFPLVAIGLFAQV